MLNSFAQLETIKNSVISGIPDSILNRKISQIKREYFQEELLSENLEKENFNKQNKSEIAENVLNQLVIPAEKLNENNNLNNISIKDLSFSNIKTNQNSGSNLNNTGNVNNGILIFYLYNRIFFSF